MRQGNCQIQSPPKLLLTKWRWRGFDFLSPSFPADLLQFLRFTSPPTPRFQSGRQKVYLLKSWFAFLPIPVCACVWWIERLWIKVYSDPCPTSTVIAVIRLNVMQRRWWRFLLPRRGWQGQNLCSKATFFIDRQEIHGWTERSAITYGSEMSRILYLMPQGEKVVSLWRKYIHLA